MILKLTGIDQAGKSTLAANLRSWGFQVQHHPFTPGRPDLFEYYSRLLEEPGPAYVVWDRGFISEHVYGPVLRGQSRLSDAQFSALLDRLAGVPAIVVHVWEARTLLDERLTASGDRYPAHAVVRAHLDPLAERYSEVLEVVEEAVPVIRFQPTVDAPHAILDAARRLI